MARAHHRIAARIVAAAIAITLALLVVPFAERTEAAPFPGPDPVHHLGIALDARAFISESDFERQKRAVADLILDPKAIPRDGSTALSVIALWPDGGLGVQERWLVQWSAVDSDDEAQAMAQAVLELEQAPLTGAAGLDTFAVNNWPSGYDYETYESADVDKGLVSVCQVLFAQPSADLASNAAWRVVVGSNDRVDILGVAGYGNNGVSASERELDDHAWGGTGYTYVPYASLLGEKLREKCLADIPKVIGMEVNQAIQNLDGSIQLIAGKETVVRVFAERLRPASSTSFEARLRVTRVLPGNPSGQSRLIGPVSPSKGFSLPLDYRAARENTGSRNEVLEFKIPPAWTAEGELQLELVSPDLMTCAWVHPAVLDLPQYCGKTINFIEGPEITVVAYRLNMTGFPQPTKAQVAEQMRRLESTMPVGDAHLLVRGGLWGADNASPFQVNVALWAARHIESGSLWRREHSSYFYYGFADKPGKAGPPKVDSHRGMGFLGVGTSSVNSSAGEAATLKPGPWRHVFPHEIAHAAGLPHVLAAPAAGELPLFLPTSTGGTIPLGHTLWTDTCGAQAVLPQGNTPYWYFTVTQPGNVNGVGMPVSYPVISAFTGEGSNFDFSHSYEFWGLDTRFVGQAPKLAAVDPRLTGELMSYVNSSKCTLEDSPDRLNRRANDRNRYWVSLPSYETLKYIFLDPQAFGPISDVGLPAPVVWGLVGASSGTELGPVLDMPGGTIAEGNEYGFVLRAYDADGNLLSETAPTVEQVPDAAGEDEDAEPGEPGFVFVGQLEPGDIRRVDLALDGDVVSTASASEHEPTVSILEPSAGASAETGPLTIAWQGDDADGGELRYSVLFSPDGESWQMLASRIDSTQFELPTTEVPATDGGTIKVVVDDGFLSSEAAVGGIVIPEHAPEVIVAEPFPGQEFAPGDYISLRAYVFDADEGPLPDEDVVWSSDADGVLDFDPLVGLRTTDLTPGERVLTATVTDSTGRTETHSVEVALVSADGSSGSGTTGGSGSSGGGGAGSSGVVPTSPTATATPEPSPSPSSSANPAIDDDDASPDAPPSPDVAAPTDDTSAAAESGVGRLLLPAVLVLLAGLALGVWFAMRRR